MGNLWGLQPTSLPAYTDEIAVEFVNNGTSRTLLLSHNFFKIKEESVYSNIEM